MCCRCLGVIGVAIHCDGVVGSARGCVAGAVGVVVLVVVVVVVVVALLVRLAVGYLCYGDSCR
eukprot:3848810-Alexandrium_andersonii.AAC.1